MAAAAGRWAAMNDPAVLKRFPYVIYHAKKDSYARNSHTTLDGKIFRKDDPFLTTHTPPWEFNCRCWLENCDEKTAGGKAEPPTPPDKVKVESESGFEFNPANAFGEFDLGAIKNDTLRAQTATAMAEKFGVLASEKDGVYRMNFADETKTSAINSKILENVPEDASDGLNSEAVYNKIKTGEKTFDASMRRFVKKAPKTVRKLVVKASVPKIIVDDSRDLAGYHDGTIYILPTSSEKNRWHEYWHNIDDNVINADPALRDLKYNGIGAILDDMGERLKTDEVFRNKVETLLYELAKKDSQFASTVADIFGAASYNEVGYGHDLMYWQRNKTNRQNEVVAQLGILYGRQVKEWQQLQKLTPELAKKFQELILKASR